MSKHEVKVVKVENIRVHPNADSLEITDVWGYQCVVGKGKHKVGDLLAFIEPDYTVPLNRAEFAFLDKGKGKLRERITMRKFRGEPSYGLLIQAPAGSQEGDDVMSLLDVERYEPPMGGSGKGGPTGFMSGLCETGPEFPVPVYDLENFKKYHKLFEEGEEVILTEKVHGTNGRFVFAEGKMFCGSRTTWKKAPGVSLGVKTYKNEETGEEITREMFTPDSAWWAALKQNPWIEAWCRAHEGVVLYGEVYGPNVQGAQFHYGKNQGEYGFAVFDILDHGRWVDNTRLFDDPAYTDGLVETVKLLYRGPLDKTIVFSLSELDSIYPNQLVREGVVIKPVQERRDMLLGRIALKNVSDRYLSM